MTHTHSVVDTDPHFIIDENSRAITFRGDLPIIVQHDHNSEQFTFELPRMIDGHDMTLCNSVRVHYINIDSGTKDTNPGVYDVDTLSTVAGDDARVEFSWLISTNATKFAGKLNFKIQFLCVEDGVVTYAWNTAINSDLTISNGMDSGEAIVEEYTDILTEWDARITALEEGGGGTVKTVNGIEPDENGAVKIDAVTTEQLERVEAKIPTDTVTSDELSAVADGIPTDDHINDLINTALGVIENGAY